jgi:hypothetical protein
MAIWKMGIVEELKAVLPSKSEPETPNFNSSNATMRPQGLEVEEEAETPQSFQTPSEEQQLEKRWQGYLAEAGMRKFRYMSYREKGIMEK